MIVGYIIVQEIKCPNCGEVFWLMNRVMRRLHSKLETKNLKKSL